MKEVIAEDFILHKKCPKCLSLNPAEMNYCCHCHAGLGAPATSNIRTTHRLNKKILVAVAGITAIAVRYLLFR